MEMEPVDDNQIRESKGDGPKDLYSIVYFYHTKNVEKGTGVSIATPHN